MFIGKHRPRGRATRKLSPAGRISIFIGLTFFRETQGHRSVHLPTLEFPFFKGKFGVHMINTQVGFFL
jgi:hypothetical protein